MFISMRMRLLTPVGLLRQNYGLNRNARRGIATTVNRRSNTKLHGDVWVEASPRVCLHDVHTELKAGGLAPNSPVTLRADLIDEHGKHFCSNAHYIADEKGEVDLEKAASVGGSYQGIFPAGLLTTLSTVQLDKNKRFHRLFRRNTLTPWKATVSVNDGHTDLTSEEKSLASVELERHLTAPGTKRIEVKHGRVRGALYLPPDPGPFPGVIDIFGFVGGLFEFRSAMLSSRGFACLALAVFNYDDLPVTPDEMHFEYFEEAMKFLLNQPQVIPDRCGIICNSKSGDIGFNMAILFEQVKAVISVNAVTFPFYSGYYFRGEQLMPRVELPFEVLVTGEDGLTYTDLTPHFSNDNPHIIPVEKADDDTHFMVVCGDADPGGFEHSITAFEERMKKANKTNYETILYKGVGHLVHPPYDPVCYASFQPALPILGERGNLGFTFKWGGTPLETCEAQVDLWKRTLDFFNRHVRDKSPWYYSYLQNSSKD